MSGSKHKLSGNEVTALVAVAVLIGAYLGWGITSTIYRADAAQPAVSAPAPTVTVMPTPAATPHWPLSSAAQCRIAVERYVALLDDHNSQLISPMGLDAFEGRATDVHWLIDTQAPLNKRVHQIAHITRQCLEDPQ